MDADLFFKLAGNFVKANDALRRANGQRPRAQAGGAGLSFGSLPGVVLPTPRSGVAGKASACNCFGNRPKKG